MLLQDHFHMRTRSFLFIYMVSLLNKMSVTSCYPKPNVLWNHKTLYLSVDFHRRGWICRRLQSRETQTSVSVPVCASSPSQEQGRQSRAQNNDEVHAAKVEEAARWSLFNWSDHEVQSLISAIIAGLFFSPPGMPASPYKWCSVLPKSKS